MQTGGVMLTSRTYPMVHSIHYGPSMQLRQFEIPQGMHSWVGVDKSCT